MAGLAPLDPPLPPIKYVLGYRFRNKVQRFNPKRRFRIDTEVRCVGAYPLFGPLSRRGLNPINIGWMALSI